MPINFLRNNMKGQQKKLDHPILMRLGYTIEANAGQFLRIKGIFFIVFFSFLFLFLNKAPK